MWAKQIGATDSEPKCHFFSDNISLCEKVKLTSSDYIRYTDTEEKCKSCILVQQKMVSNIRMLM